MREPESRIKDAILHDDVIVRETAAWYFCHSYTADVEVMPRIIQAIEQFGEDQAFEFYWFVATLPQTEETVGWLIDFLKDQDASSERESSLISGAVGALRNAPVEILARREAEWMVLAALGDVAKRHMSERISLRTASPLELWAELEMRCEEEDKYDDDLDTDLLDRIVEVLSRHRKFCAPRVLRVLEESQGDWLEYYTIKLAGELQLQEAAAALIGLQIDLDDAAFVEWERALVKIGGDDVVRELATAYESGEADLRISVASALENIHTDFCLETCLRLLGTETDDEIRHFLIAAALQQFAREAIEPARQYVLATPPDPEVREVRKRLLAVCQVVGEHFPEFEAWRQDARHDRELNREWYRTNVPLSGLFDDEDGPGLLGEYDDVEDEFDPYVDPPVCERPAPIVREGLVGRNDPCPCGSGKKFKKCCLRVQDGEGVVAEAQPRPKYPIGTVAHYGPDNRQTTKVVAAVFRRPEGEAIMMKWFGAKVADDPKVRREVRKFFDKYHVQTVVGPLNNLGCPHEEGIDFPHGEDCPQCPYWAGKQGSNRHA